MRERAIHRARLLRLFEAGGVVLFVLFGGVLLVLAAEWPFTREATIRSLERVSASDVQVINFHKTFFPSPGYIAQDVTFKRPGSRPIATVGKITCKATWAAMLSFTHRISRMDLDRLKVYIPAHVPPPVRKHAEAKIKTTVTQLFANGAILDIAPRHQGGQTVHCSFPQLTLSNVAGNKPIHLQVLMRNPNPPGDLKVSGTVGPFISGKVGDIRISGAFQFRHADLSAYKVIRGKLSADGRFQGTLGRSEVSGQTKIPNFEITSSRHSVGLTAEYHAIVNGINGDVAVESAQAHFLGTTLLAHGAIAGRKAKTVSLDFDARQARIQDLLRLFVSADRPPLDGPISLRAHVVLPPTHRPFIRRVKLDGNFTITDADFSNSKTQEKVDELSARARGNKGQIKSRNGPEHITEDLKGNVRLREGIATLSSALFGVPGAVARGGGTYALTTKAIDLRGRLAMHVSVSKAAGGFKSILLIPLDPLFKKNGAGAVLPVRISGTYSHPIFKVSLTRK
jgi:AsmA-like C-terminal region